MRQKQYNTTLLLFFSFNILDTNKKHFIIITPKINDFDLC